MEESGNDFFVNLVYQSKQIWTVTINNLFFDYLLCFSRSVTKKLANKDPVKVAYLKTYLYQFWKIRTISRGSDSF